MQAEDIARINAEMQRRPDDSYLEIVGHYVIDRLSAGAGPLQEIRTLGGCMKVMTEAAKRKARHDVGVLTSAEVYEIVDRYFGLPADFAAQQKSAKAVCTGADIGSGESVTPPGTIRPTTKPVVNLYDFM